MSKSKSTLASHTLDQVVDLMEFSSYRDLNLDEQPIMVLECKHFFSVETLDGILGLDKYYNSHGKCVDLDHELTMPPTCPTCRKPITQLLDTGELSSNQC